MKTDYHAFTGLRRDVHPIKQEAKYLWGAHNIRLTAREGNTFMSLTNEKSTRHIKTFGNEEYVGHVTCGNYLVLFTHTEEYDTIHRFNLDTEEDIILYKGDLNFNTDNPIQAISDFESELIQKVYWTDGINRPRVINIVKPELRLKKEDEDLPYREDYTEIYNDAPFDFVQELQLNEEVTVKRIDGSVGVFQPGVIQYAFTYYHKYGQESNIFYVTEPAYIAFPDRGGAADQSISTSFEITLNNLEHRFDYLRVYSILRTSLNAVPTVKRVMDVELINKGEQIKIIDNNTTGDTVDPSMLLYIGGKDIITQCIHAKDGVLFLGNIGYKRKEIGTIEFEDKSLLKDRVRYRDEENTGLPITSQTATRYIRYTKDDTFVNTWPPVFGDDTEILSITPELDDKNLGNYKNQLDLNTSTFKVGETYRLGVQFQYKNGEWSEPLFINDEIMDTVHPSIDTKKVIYRTFNTQYDHIEYYRTISLPSFSTILNKEYIDILRENGYLKVRPIMVMPDYKDRTIVAQGVLCPTLYNKKQRLKSTPYVQSSWFIRPSLEGERDLIESDDASKGEEAEYRHDKPLASGLSRGAEIQNTFSANLFSEIDTAYYVDRSIITFHSPDLIFNESLRNVIDSGTNLSVGLVGEVHFNRNCGDIDIQTSSATVSSAAGGFIHQTIDGDGGRSLISGLFYADGIVEYYPEGEGTYDAKRSESSNPDDGIADTIIRWMVYLWNRSGSLNNDVVRGTGQGTRTSELKLKKISNIKYSDTVNWFENITRLYTSKLSLFDSNEISLIKIKKKNGTDITDNNDNTIDMTYYGNVDSLSGSQEPYRLVFSNTFRSLGKESFDYTVPWEFELYRTTSLPSGESYVTKLGTGTFSVVYNESNGYFRGTITKYNVLAQPDNYTIGVGWRIEFFTDTITAPNAWFDLVKIALLNYNQYTVGDPGSYHLRVKTVGDDIYGGTTFRGFNGPLNYIKRGSEAPGNNDISVGKDMSSLAVSKDPVRIKYKSTPHVVFANLDSNEKLLPLGNSRNCPSLFMAELRQEVPDDVRYGGKTDEALRSNLWIPAGPSLRLDGESLKIDWLWGDTWYQRYDLMKTYPFTNEDENQLIEIASFMCESRVNLDGRTDRNRFQKNNLDMSPQNFNLMNDVYSQLDNFFNYRIFDADFYKVNTYPSQMLWTLIKAPASDTDNWTNLYSANTLDFDGTHGPLNAIISANDTLIGFQDTAVNNISFNSRVEIQASDGVPIELANSGRVDGYTYLSSTSGCKDKFSMCNTQSGIYFLDSNNDAIYNIGEGIGNLSASNGALYWTRENHTDYLWNFNNSGIRIDYDPKYGDIYFTPGDRGKYSLCFSEQAGEFISEYSYGGSVMVPYNSKLYSIANNPSGELTLWENFEGEGYNNIFGINRDFDFSFISNDAPQYTKIFDTIEMRTDSYNNNSIISEDDIGYMERRDEKKFLSEPFSYIKVSNEYQDTGEIPFNALTLRKKYRVWRGIIPRQEKTRNRIVNTWCKITLGKRDTSTEDFTILHDIGVNYTE